VTGQRWFWPVIGGVTVAVIVFFAILKPESATQRVARENGYNVAEYETSVSIGERLGGEKPLSSSAITQREFEDVKRLVESGNADLVTQNIGYLHKFRDTPFESEAATLARRFLTSDNTWHVRAAALTLYRLKVADLPTIKTQLMQHPHEDVRTYVQNW
jgi:hypothetical protein